MKLQLKIDAVEYIKSMDDYGYIEPVVVTAGGVTFEVTVDNIPHDLTQKVTDLLLELEDSKRNTEYANKLCYGLKENVQRLQALIPSPYPLSTPPTSEELVAIARYYLAVNNPITAIKVIRLATQWSLMEAKNFVDAIKANPTVIPEHPPVVSTPAK